MAVSAPYTPHVVATDRVPAVSLVVPMFNEQPEVMTRSLRSVAEQSFADFECLVIDESTDATAAAACAAFCAEDPRFRRVTPPARLGLPASLNLGIELSRAPLVARFDSDDLCLPHRLQTQVTYLDSHADVDVVGGSLELIDDNDVVFGVRHYPEHHADIVRTLQFTTPLAHPTVMLRRRAFELCGTYDPTFGNAEDLDLWLRFANQGIRFANVPDILVRYRQQFTRRAPRHWRFNLKARIRNFDRQFFVRRIGGIAAILIWSLMPGRVQELLFRTLVLRKRRLREEAARGA